MHPEKSEAIVIRQVDFSETSKIVTLFSREFGKIGALAKGARRLKGPFEAALDLLSTCRIVFLRKSAPSLHLLTEAQLIARFRPTGRNLLSLYAGYYVAELLDSLTEHEDPHPVLYDEAAAALGRLAVDDDHQSPLIRFEIAILREIGQLPSFDGCLVCGASTEEDVAFSFWVSQSGLICRNCQKEEYSHLNLGPSTRAVLKSLTEESFDASHAHVVGPRELNELRPVLTAAISHVLGHRPKMLRYLGT